MQTNLVTSTRVASVAYEQRTRHLILEFKDGTVRDYAGVGIGLYHQVLLPHPWRRVGEQLDALPHRDLHLVAEEGD